MGKSFRIFLEYFGYSFSLFVCLASELLFVAFNEAKISFQLSFLSRILLTAWVIRSELDLFGSHIYHFVEKRMCLGVVLKINQKSTELKNLWLVSSVSLT